MFAQFPSIGITQQSSTVLPHVALWSSRWGTPQGRTLVLQPDTLSSIPTHLRPERLPEAALSPPRVQSCFRTQCFLFGSWKCTLVMSSFWGSVSNKNSILHQSLPNRQNQCSNGYVLVSLCHRWVFCKLMSVSEDLEFHKSRSNCLTWTVWETSPVDFRGSS